jgi:hypothetical protein
MFGHKRQIDLVETSQSCMSKYGRSNCESDQTSMLALSGYCSIKTESVGDVRQFVCELICQAEA